VTIMSLPRTKSELVARVDDGADVNRVFRPGDIDTGNRGPGRRTFLAGRPRRLKRATFIDRTTDYAFHFRYRVTALNGRRFRLFRGINNRPRTETNWEIYIRYSCRRLSSAVHDRPTFGVARDLIHRRRFSITS